MLAIVFSEKRDRKALWQKALEGWNVIESPYLNELTRQVEKNAEDRARKETTRSILLETLEIRFKTKLSPGVAAAVTANASLDDLHQWQRYALTCDSLEDFLHKIGLTNGHAAP